MGGTHWTCFYMKDTKSIYFYFYSFREPPDKFQLQQLPKPISYHNFILQDKYSMLCAGNTYTYSI